MQQRQRLKALDRFKADPAGVLIATDVAARGLDVPVRPLCCAVLCCAVLCCAVLPCALGCPGLPCAALYPSATIHQVGMDLTYFEGMLLAQDVQAIVCVKAYTACISASAYCVSRHWHWLLTCFVNASETCSVASP